MTGVFQFEVQLDNWLLAERKRLLIGEEQRPPLEN
jgi:RNA polymerase I-specific transcription initiation factor RRN7